MFGRQTLFAATRHLNRRACADAGIGPDPALLPNQGELKSLDPYTLKETTTIAHHAHVYEGLVTRDKDLKVVRRWPKAGKSSSRRVGAFICARASNSTTETPSPPTTCFFPPSACAPKAPTF